MTKLRNTLFIGFSAGLVTAGILGNMVFASEVTRDPGAWSAEVNAVKARLTLQRDEVIDGTPVIATTLTLKNESDLNNSTKFPWTRAKLKFRVVDGDSKVAPIYMGPYNEMVATPLDLVLPHKGDLSFDISHHGAGIAADKPAEIDLGSGQAWVIPDNNKTYYLTGTLEIPEIERSQLEHSWFGKIDLPAVKIPVHVEAIDTVKSGKLIAQWGPKILASDSRLSAEAWRRLSFTNDERVIPWYLKALDTNDYSLKFTALERLARFNSDQALSGLKKGAKTRGKDIANCTTAALANQSAENIRLCAASALARSPHPQAKQLLLTMWQDPAMGVRIDVAQTAQKMDTPESLTILQKLTKDPNKDVRTESARCLKLREGK